jgi:hypothetical protein
MSKLKLLLYAAPIAATVLNSCKKLGMNPLLPVVGLIAGIALEMQRP